MGRDGFPEVTSEVSPPAAQPLDGGLGISLPALHPLPGPNPADLPAVPPVPHERHLPVAAPAHDPKVAVGGQGHVPGARPKLGCGGSGGQGRGPRRETPLMPKRPRCWRLLTLSGPDASSEAGPTATPLP